jgi:hypothetical protein
VLVTAAVALRWPQVLRLGALDKVGEEGGAAAAGPPAPRRETLRD